MIRKILLLFLPFWFSAVPSQILTGEVFLKDNSAIFLNQIYITNLRTQKTVLSAYDGTFKISATSGDAIRFSSVSTERKDITVTVQMLANKSNFYELKPQYIEIPGVELSSFKATGNLRKDVAMLKTGEKALALNRMLGIPAPKGNGLPPEQSVAAFTGGGLTFGLNAIYDIISGEKIKKERYQKYEKMTADISNIRKYFGEDYFSALKIPKNFVDNFLQFVYTSGDLSFQPGAANFEIAKPSIEKYLPIYLKRLKSSSLMQHTDI